MRVFHCSNLLEESLWKTSGFGTCSLGPSYLFWSLIDKVVAFSSNVCEYCQHVCTWTTHVPGICRGQKRALKPWECCELPRGCWEHTWSSGIATGALKPSSLPQSLFLKFSLMRYMEWIRLPLFLDCGLRLIIRGKCCDWVCLLWKSLAMHTRLML